MEPPRTLLHWLEKWAEERPDVPALFSRGSDGDWSCITWKEYFGRVRAVARGLIACGHRPGEPVSIVGANRPEWVIAQLGINAAGGVPAPIYPTNTEEQTAYIIEHAGVKIAICENRELLDKHLSCLGKGLMRVNRIVTMDDLGASDERVMTLSELEKLGDDDAEVDRRMAAWKPEETSLFIFTSGTTGLPKGAELSSEGILMVAAAIRQIYPDVVSHDYVVVSYLPLSHAAEQLFTNFLSLTLGGQVYFCPELRQVKDYLLEARPSVFLGVPRVWEKLEAAIRAKGATVTGLKAKIGAWARRTELEAFKESVRLGRPVDTFGRRIATRLVTGKVREALGLDRLLFAASGAAPIATSTLEFFASFGIVVHEGYGMTETSAVATAQPQGFPRFGTVGRALPGVEIDIAADGEVLLRGKNMIKRYFKLPDKTAELYEGGEWLHTGDLGEVDADGFLRITGRKKDLIITAAGKNVAPVEIEQHLVTIPGVGQAVVVGDRRPYLTCLFALDPDGFAMLAAAAGSSAGTIAELSRCAKARKYVEEHIERECNPRVARYQTVKKFEILPAPFSVDGGELTPTMKVKRNVVNEKYAAEIAGMYAAEGGAAASSG